MHTDSLRYLKNVGIDFKPAESPDLWLHLESHFADPNRIGPKFLSLPDVPMAELIEKGEDAILKALAAHHSRTGKVVSVAEVIEMPFIVGTDSSISLKDADQRRLLVLIDQPGTTHERIVHILPAKADAIPATHHVTVTGGLYPDGHTAGYYSLHPGNHPDTTHANAWLATTDEIKTLTSDMGHKIDDIAVVTRKECEAMIAKVRKILDF